MDRIDRTLSESAALEALGLSASATVDMIRSSWRRIAFETHPDRPDGSLPDFLAAKAAYDFLTNRRPKVRSSETRRPEPETRRPEPEPRRAARAEEPAAERVRPARATRPSVSRRVVETTAEARAECQSLLDAAPAAGAIDHVASAVEYQGRGLVILVATPMAAGLNRVAAPTAMFEDRRKVKPKIVSLRASAEGAAKVRLPEALCEAYFPGARSVEIRFGVEAHAGAA